ncbi:hypothetical protein Sru01_67990 [Sphaerisporangium rufum]|uniref:Uncharacterized protein n=1 Tax=Sphaerisporangium rufum TaxID=1381558 RepID=A0A919RD23_9ACTN|nr:hypothetical protein [Sphaerisporangium rufum]GII81817.1 hypothetical protein Sru01_67990 [Sphaerisporangium rufum]
MVFGGWRDRRAARRVRPGNGEPLPRFRWWQLLSRSVRTLTLRAPDGTASTYAVDVRQLGDRDDGAIRARLYRDGALVSLSTMPARFPVPGGHIEVAVGTYGLRRCHHVRADGTAKPLTPHPASAEGRRAHLHRTRPGLSRLVGAVSALLVLVGICVAVPQLAATISHIPPVADALGAFDLPVHVPVAANIAAGVAAVVGSTERALRLRSNWLDTLAS